MNLFEDLTELYGDLFGLHSELGDPRCKELAFFAYSPGNTTPVVTRISPTPLLTTPPRQLIGIETSVGQPNIISDQDYYVKLPRTYQKTLFKQKCYVEAEFNGSTLIRGIPAVVVYIGDKQSLYWELVIKKNKDFAQDLEIDNG